MSHGEPMTLFDCAPLHAWPLIATSAVIVILYIDLTVSRFLPAARSASTVRGKWVWYSIAFIFPFCGITGYATIILAGWAPGFAYTLKTFFALLDIVACLAFRHFTKGVDLAAISAEEKLKEAREEMRTNHDGGLTTEQALERLENILRD